MVEDSSGIRVPFDMTKATLNSIRNWIDKISEVSLCMFGSEIINSNDMIVLKHKMVKQLIVLSSPMLEDDREEIEEFFFKIKIEFGNVRNSNGWNRGVPVYSKDTDYKLDQCIQMIEESLQSYFIPIINNGERY